MYAKPRESCEISIPNNDAHALAAMLDRMLRLLSVDSDALSTLHPKAKYFLNNQKTRSQRRHTYAPAVRLSCCDVYFICVLAVCFNFQVLLNQKEFQWQKLYQFLRVGSTRYVKMANQGGFKAM
ncbi:hypothetical protein VNO78_32135 [Psophocarpus tetragonolobus]|uniref:Uncharacterized protein n=1 Tax=Psophocarpus tetragonolobus TaxID=3891 RepID=A0AAN9RZG4_PSOTE